MPLYGTVIVETQFTGPVEIDIETGTGEPSSLFQALKPKAVVITPFGQYVYAPYGMPDPSKRALYKSIALVGVAGIALILVLFFKSRK